MDGRAWDVISSLCRVKVPYNWKQRLQNDLGSVDGDVKPQHNNNNTLWQIRWNKTSIWTASSEFGTYHLCEQRRFRRACASAQSRQNLRCSLIQAVSQEEPSDRKPDPWPLWMAGHAQLKHVMTECSKTQIRLTGLIYRIWKLGNRQNHVK